MRISFLTAAFLHFLPLFTSALPNQRRGLTTLDAATESSTKASATTLSSSSEINPIALETSAAAPVKAGKPVPQDAQELASPSHEVGSSPLQVAKLRKSSSLKASKVAQAGLNLLLALNRKAWKKEVKGLDDEKRKYVADENHKYKTFLYEQNKVEVASRVISEKMFPHRQKEEATVARKADFQTTQTKNKLQYLADSHTRNFVFEVAQKERRRKIDAKHERIQDRLQAASRKIGTT